MVDRLAADWRTAGLDEATLALLAYSEKLTREPGEMSDDDVAGLHTAGWDDRGISDATQVCAYFNYINRVADALGVHPEDWIDPQGRPLGVPGETTS